MAIFAVLAVMVVLSFGLFFLITQSHQLRRTTVNVLEEETAFQIARGCAEIYWTFLDDALRRQDGLTKLFPQDGSVSPLNLQAGSTPDGLVLPTSAFARSADLQEAVRWLTLSVPGLKDVVMESAWTVEEKSASAARGKILLEVGLQFRGRSYSLSFPREFKLIQTLPPVISKFTLFVKECPDPNQYNVIAKDFQQDGASKNILTLFHSSQPFKVTGTDQWRRSGWVFHGGPKILLNIDGTHPCRQQSENFIFWPTFVLNGALAELPFAVSPFLGGSQFRVRFTPIGAMKDWVTSPKLREVLGEVVSAEMLHSSALHLFGDKNRMTPTRVVGNVQAAYSIYSSLILDADSDSVPDNVPHSSGIAQRGIFPLPRLVKGNDYLPPLRPTFVSSKGFDYFTDGVLRQGFPLITDLMPEYAVGNPNDYVTYMTKLSTDFSPESGLNSYNALYDQMLDNAGTTNNKSFPAPRLLESGDYPNTGTVFTLPADQQGGGKLFKGDLNAFDPAAVYQEPLYVTDSFDTANDFLAGLVRRQGKPVLTQPRAAFVKAGLNLPELENEARTVIIVESDVTVSGVKRNNPGARLTLVSLNGNITVGAGKLEGVSLIAPKGAVTWSSPLDLEGTLCCRKLDLTSLTVGGEIRYSETFDPTDPKQFQSGYAVALGPDIPRPLKKGFGL